MPTRPGTWLIKAVTLQGVESPSAARICTNVSATPMNAVARFVGPPQWPGAMQGCHVDGPDLRLAGRDMMARWPVLSTLDALAGPGMPGWNMVVEAGTFTWSRTIDLGAVYTSRVTPNLSVYGQVLDDVMARWPVLGEMDGLVGADASKWDAVLEMRTTDEDPSAPDAPWSDWRAATVGDVAARGYRARLRLSTSDRNITPIVARAELRVDMPDRILTGTDIPAPTGGRRIDFVPPYCGLTGVSISAQGLRSGDIYEITGKDTRGFDIRFRDRSGRPVERIFDYLAIGYGKGQT